MWWCLQVWRLATIGLAAALFAGVAALASVQVEAPGDARLLVVDTDAGADDGLALLELLRAEAISYFPDGPSRVVAITCVHGNTGVHNVTKNVFAVLDIVGRLDVPVYVGASGPLLPPPVSLVDEYFGADGFGDFLPPGPPAGKPQQEHAAVALVRLAKEHPGELTLVCIGPLTNVALAVRLDPGFLDNLRDLYILGAAARGNGNSNPGVEFNMKGDPDAALVVFDAVKKPVYLLPWETVLSAALPMAWRTGVLGAQNSTFVQFLNLAERVSLPQTEAYRSGDGLLAAYILDHTLADLLPGDDVRVSVLGGQGPGRGVSLVDYSNTTGMPGNARIVNKVDTESFKRLMLTLLA